MKSIKTKMMVYVLPVVFIAIIGIVVIFYRFTYDEILKSTYAELDTAAYGYSQQVQAWFAEKTGAMKTGARAIESTDGTDSSILNYLKVASEDFVADGAGELYMGTKDGGMLFLSGSLPEGYDSRERPWYIEAAKTDQVIFTEPYMDASGRYDMSVSTSVKVKEKDGTLKGILATDLSLGFVSDQTKNIKLGETGYIFAIDNQSGMIVLHPESEVLGQNIFEVFPDFKRVLENISKDPFKNNSYNEINGERYWVGHAGIDLLDWTLFTVKSENEALEPINNLLYAVGILVGFVGIILVLVLIYSISKITKPIKGLLKEINQIGSGNFSMAIPLTLMKQKDEIGIFARTVEKMRVDIRNIIENIMNTSTQNNENISSVFEKIDYLDTYINEVSQITQKLSVNVKDMASSTEKTTHNATEIENTVDTIATKSYENMDNMEKMKDRALHVMTHSKESWEQANQTREEVENKLGEAIKQSAVIERISVLSNTIMQITEETNLLALNAAIEAARAGEQGKGFAVVASEIKKLSDSSQDAVSQIKEVIVRLEDAVAELVNTSQLMLDFFKNQIITDYEEMVKTGEQYHGDASSASAVFLNFSENTQSLNRSIKMISNVLGEIAITSQESFEENKKVTEKSVLLLDNSKDILEMVKDTKEKSVQLMKIVENFKI